MNKKFINQGTPLHIWVKASLITLILLTVLYFLLHWRDQHLVNQLDPSRQLHEFSNVTNKEPDAYFLGSSLTRYALLENQTLDSILLSKNMQLNYRTVVCDGSVLNVFNSKMEEIRELRPKFLIIESNLALLDLYDPALWHTFRVRLARIPLYLLTLRTSAIALIKNYGAESLAPRLNFFPDFEGGAGTSGKNYGRNFKVRSIEDFPLWNNFFHDADSLGIQVFFLEFPRSDEADKRLSEKMKYQIKNLANEYHSRYKIKYIGFPDKLSKQKYYLDFAHFNAAGSRYYCDWLIQELSARKLINSH